MTVNVFLVLLSIFSVAIAFITEGLKKIKITENHSTNLIVFLVSAIVGWGGSFAAYILLSIPFTPVSITALVLMAPASFFSATQGYDKVVQTIKQMTQIADQGNL